MKHVATIVLLLGGSVAAAACGSDSSETTAAPAPDAAAQDAPAEDAATNRVQGEIGPEGGSITSLDGRVTLEVPPGALAQAVTLSIAPTTTALPDAVGSGYDLEPSGTLFDLPVKLSIRYDPSHIPAGRTETDVTLATTKNGATDIQQWAVVDTSSHTVTGFIPHLSPWYAAAVPQPKDPCKVDVPCADSCCKGAFSGSECGTTCTGLGDTVSFIPYTDCYAKCVGTPSATNYANSECLGNCCTAQGGTAASNGACFVGSLSDALAAIACAAGCFGPGDTVTVCAPGSQSCGDDAGPSDGGLPDTKPATCTQGNCSGSGDQLYFAVSCPSGSYDVSCYVATGPDAGPPSCLCANGKGTVPLSDPAPVISACPGGNGTESYVVTLCES